MKRILLTLTTYLCYCLNARAESLCDLQIVMRDFDARYGEAIVDTPYLVYKQPTFRVIVVFDPPQGRPWATDIYFLTKKTAFTKAEVQGIERIMSALPGTYSKETSATQIHFQLESYTKP